jgi:hypothetical protein
MGMEKEYRYWYCGEDEEIRKPGAGGVGLNISWSWLMRWLELEPGRETSAGLPLSSEGFRDYATS